MPQNKGQGQYRTLKLIFLFLKEMAEISDFQIQITALVGISATIHLHISDQGCVNIVVYKFYYVKDKNKKVTL